MLAALALPRTPGRALTYHWSRLAWAARFASGYSSRRDGDRSIQLAARVEGVMAMCHAIPGRIESIDGDDDLTRIGWVSFGGIEKNVSLACVPAAQEGDYVLVHAGLAIATIDGEAACATLQQRPEVGSPREGSGA